MEMKASTALALALLGFASPIVAQGQSPDLDQNGIVSREEAETDSERLFDEIAEGGEMGVGQFVAANAATEAEVTQEEAEGAANPGTALDQVDTDQNGAISREEWMQWRLEQFDDAAGGPAQEEVEGPEAEEGIEYELYQTLYSRGMPGVEKGGAALTEDAPDDRDAPDAGNETPTEEASGDDDGAGQAGN